MAVLQGSDSEAEGWSLSLPETFRAKQKRRKNGQGTREEGDPLRSARKSKLIKFV